MKTRDQLITDALEKIGALGLNETPTANQITRGASALTSLFNTFHTFGMPLWKLHRYSFSFGLFTNGYATMGTSGTLVTSSMPLKLIGADRYDSTSQVTVPLNVYTRNEYFDIPAPVNAVPTQIYFVPKKTYAEVYLWPYPDSYWQTNGSLLIDVQESTDVITSGTDLPDAPDEWEEAIIYGLADRLAPNYGVPVQERAALTSAFKERLDEVLRFGSEGASVYIQPDTTPR